MLPDARLFDRRAEPEELAEWMDEPCSYEDFRTCLHDLAQVNRITLAHRPTMAWLDSRRDAFSSHTPLHIVDVGSGGGDMLRHVARWAQHRKLAVKLTGIDLNPYAARAAQEFATSPYRIEWVTGDAFSYAPPGGIDIVLSSLFTHHLPQPEIVRFLAWMERIAKHGWFVNDLLRSRKSYALFASLAKFARWHRFVQHDGPVSIRRSFREVDWQRLCAQAQVPAGAALVQSIFPGRLCVGRWKGTPK